MRRTITILATLVLVSASALAAPGHNHGSAKKPAATKGAVVCPVMGNKIASASKAAAKSVYKGKTYYFCCPGCKPMFDKNPAKYIKTPKK